MNDVIAYEKKLRCSEFFARTPRQSEELESFWKKAYQLLETITRMGVKLMETNFSIIRNNYKPKSKNRFSTLGPSFNQALLFSC